MNIQKLNGNEQNFGQTAVKIKYKDLKKLGDNAVDLAEKVKSRLEVRDPSIRYTIGRHYKLERGSNELPGLFVGTDKIYIEAKQVNQGFKAKLKNFFNINPSAYKTTATHSERSLMQAANKVTKEVQASEKVSIFSILRSSSTILETGPR